MASSSLLSSRRREAKVNRASTLSANVCIAETKKQVKHFTMQVHRKENNISIYDMNAYDSIIKNKR